LDALRFQMVMHCLEYLHTQVMALQQVTEPANGGLVRPQMFTQVNAGEVAQRGGVVQRLLRTRVRQIEPLLEEVNTQHHPQVLARSTVARMGVVRCNQRAQVRPRHNAVHVTKKLRPSRRLAVFLEPGAHAQLFHYSRSPPDLPEQGIRSGTFAEVPKFAVSFDGKMCVVGLRASAKSSNTP